MRVMHNIPALMAYNALSATNAQLQKSIEKLSTGLRINSAADDAAGLAISEKMRAQIRGLDRAAANAQDGISMIQTAEGALNETHSILQRMRELSVQAANDTLTQEDRAYIQLEVDQLKEEITRIASTTQFNKKKLLDGSAAALWSSDKLSTKAIINGGLRQVDQFGQKSALEGNFKLSISAIAGQTEVQKSDIFKIKHPDVIMNATLNRFKGVEDLKVNGLPAGTYTINQNETTLAGAIGTWQTGNAKVFGEFVAGTDLLFAALADTVSGTPSTYNDANASLLFEVVEVNADSGSVTFRVQSNVLKSDGTTASYTVDEMIVSHTGIRGATNINLGLNLAVGSMQLANKAAATKFAKGDKLVANYITNQTSAGTTGTIATNFAAITVNAEILDKPEWAFGWDDDFNTTYGMMDLKGEEIDFRHFYLNEDNGQVYQGNIRITFNDHFDITQASATDGNFLASFEATFIGQVAKGDVQLRDLDKFWDANGRFMLDDPKTITIYQGDGKHTSITLYATDTLDDVAKKMNDAVAYGLGQAQYVSNTNTGGEAPQFVSFVVDESDANNGNSIPNSHMAVPGTFVIRTVVTGAGGRLAFSGDEDIIKALSLNVIQDARENQFTVQVHDTHNGNTISGGTKITGNVLYGVVNPNVDVEFDAMANLEVEWNEKFMRFDIKKQQDLYETIVHLADNTTVYQIGANEGEDMGVNIGDMSAHSLGVHNVLVTDRASAARSITVIDNAISKVSSQRAKLGAYQNRLEHTINNLTTASTNLTAAESRIRDTDMAKEMMNFTRLNILSMAGNSMLAQANMLPQNVLSLLR